MLYFEATVGIQTEQGGGPEPYPPNPVTNTIDGNTVQVCAKGIVHNPNPEYDLFIRNIAFENIRQAFVPEIGYRSFDLRSTGTPQPYDNLYS